jgi:hypothetical protein
MDDYLGPLSLEGLNKTHAITRAKRIWTCFVDPTTKPLAELLEKSKGMLEQMPERNDYKVVKLKM